MKIGLLGFGTIGSGVYDLMSDDIIKVFDMPFKKDLIGEKYTNDPMEIVNDQQIDIVIEAMGGNDLPYKLIKASLENKKNVITSNKEVVSLHLDEFNKLAKENNVKFMFEASVGGGIPIIYTLIENTKVNDINHIYGIINGTTNFIITKIEEGMTFDDALKLAQKLGFAEADPTADLEGLDMVRKISILSDIAYNTFVDINKVYHYGIKGITKEIIDYLKLKGLSIKFVSESIRKDDSIYLGVEPIIINSNSNLAQIHNEFNSISFEAEKNGLLELSGKGAGKYPTASAMVSDVNKIIDNNANFNFTFDKEYKYIDKPKSKYFVYSLEEIDSKYIEIKEGNFYFTKEIDLKEIKNYKFYARVNTYEKI